MLTRAEGTFFSEQERRKKDILQCPEEKGKKCNGKRMTFFCKWKVTPLRLN
jgi:hypothetical protein